MGRFIGVTARGRRALRGATGVAIVAAVAFGTTPVGSTVVEREHYEGTDSFVEEELCPFPIDVDVVYRGMYHLRQGKGDRDQAYFLHDKVQFEETWSANGKYFVLSGNVLFKEIGATPLGDGLFEFRSIEAGQPFTVTDMDGNVLVRDRGVIRYTAILDTHDDSQPGADFVELVDISFGGPHPGYFTDPTTACELLAPT